MEKFRIRRRVKPTKKICNWYRANLAEIFGIKGLIPKEHLKEATMWLYSEICPPTGWVIEGTPSNPNTDVRVFLINNFGSCSVYLEKTNLKVGVIKWRH